MKKALVTLTVAFALFFVIGAVAPIELREVAGSAEEFTSVAPRERASREVRNSAAATVTPTAPVLLGQLVYDGPAPTIMIAPTAVPLEGSERCSEDAAPYIVRSGDTLWKVGERHFVTAGDLARYNKLANPDMIFTGQVICVPSAIREADRVFAEVPTPGGVVVYEVEILNRHCSHWGCSYLTADGRTSTEIFNWFLSDWPYALFSHRGTLLEAAIEELAVSEHITLTVSNGGMEEIIVLERGEEEIVIAEGTDENPEVSDLYDIILETSSSRRFALVTCHPPLSREAPERLIIWLERIN